MGEIHYGCKYRAGQRRAVTCAALQYSAAMPALSSALMQPELSIRHYHGEYDPHVHNHAQILIGLSGRLELEVGGRSAFVDASCGVVIPPGVAHGFMARHNARVAVVDAQDQDMLRQFGRFAVTPPLARLTDAASLVHAVGRAPRTLARRGIDLERLDAALVAGLHQTWNTARMAALFFLSAQRFHARLVELTGLSPQRYLRRRRLAFAVLSLRSGQTLEQTALRCGYASAGALAYALRRDRGVGSRMLRS